MVRFIMPIMMKIKRKLMRRVEIVMIMRRHG